MTDCNSVSMEYCVINQGLMCSTKEKCKQDLDSNLFSIGDLQVSFSWATTLVDIDFKCNLEYDVRALI
jgi:hypothetical protein